MIDNSRPSAHSDISTADELEQQAESTAWEDRYEALQRASVLPPAIRRRVARRFVEDRNHWVRALASRLASRGTLDVRPRRPATIDVDVITRGSKLSAQQRAALVDLVEQAQDSGGLDHLALTADRAARLVSEALTHGANGASDSLRLLQQFLRHIGYYARPRPPRSNVATIEAVLRDLPLEVELTVSGTANSAINLDVARTFVEELTSNAVDAGATRISVALERRDSAVTLSLANDGAHIEERDSHVLLDAWYTTRPGHAGLGLWIVTDQAAHIGGHAYLVDTSPVRFELLLPAVA